MGQRARVGLCCGKINESSHERRSRITNRPRREQLSRDGKAARGGSAGCQGLSLALSAVASAAFYRSGVLHLQRPYPCLYHGDCPLFFLPNSRIAIFLRPCDAHTAPFQCLDSCELETRAGDEQSGKSEESSISPGTCRLPMSGQICSYPQNSYCC